VILFRLVLQSGIPVEQVAFAARKAMFAGPTVIVIRRVAAGPLPPSAVSVFVVVAADLTSMQRANPAESSWRAGETHTDLAFSTP